MTGLVDDDPPFDDSEEARAEWGPGPGRVIATGFAGCEPAFSDQQGPAARGGRGFVIVEPGRGQDQGPTVVGPQGGLDLTRRWCWWPGLRYCFAEATAEGLWLQVAALLLELGMPRGERRLLVLGDGASWIRTWFEGLGIDSKAMVLCWWHLRKRCYESMSSAGGPKDRRRAFEKKLLGELWVGEVGARDRIAPRCPGVGQEPTGSRGSDRLSREAASVHPRLPGAATGGVMDRQHAGGEIQRLAVLGTLQAPGNELVAAGMLALAALEAARRNGELDEWRRVRELPERPMPEPVRQVA